MNCEEMSLTIVPIFQKAAFEFVRKYHSHHIAPVGSIFKIAISNGEEIVGVAIVGRPVGHKLQDGFTLEVTRNCTDGITKNVCSKLYGTAARIAKEMGYYKVITYTLESEIATSLKASGWFLEVEGVGGKKWNSSGNRIRTNEVLDLFGKTKKYPEENKNRWVKILNPVALKK